MQLTLTIDGKKYLVDVEVEEGEEVRQGATLSPPAMPLPPQPVAPVTAVLPPSPQAGDPDDKICHSPIAGVVFKIVAQVGQHLEVNDLLVILEAMKMETNITAHRSGRVARIMVAVGEAVKPGQPIAEVE
ncbi:acetyl-CoA carboxylase biotin carboxyl carrier protein subunit [Geomonas sp.]|uniref:acetyl-CoA carboxylase biotin carboxyl carrier protein subunit n=1 Tax=Geomonas sp. TaxID=2651584 RepID=UPI002B49C4F0|nr:acetyl-CoA carboxylase biotin carboxyl carrier protein subunit [Geomonas sp.]HJV35512.1 acetyl-CoA carboxylase biotin carboxyl carrier protein subunit [Geomonas sp.]